MSSFSGSYNPSLETLRQQAIALGLSPDEVKKYGDLRHKRTWFLAIEHYQVNQNNDLFSPALPSVMVNLPTDIDLNEDQSNHEKNMSNTKSAKELVPTTVKSSTSPIANSIDNMKSLSSYPTIDKPLKNLKEAYSPPSSFSQTVAHHITALSSNTLHQIAGEGDRRWLCPQCLQIESASCYLCQGAGSINQVQLTGWLLAYLELLGCSAGEINILRDGGIDPQILNLIAHTSIAIRRTGAILQRTEKWITVAS
jgi:hypothetical protein